MNIVLHFASSVAYRYHLSPIYQSGYRNVQITEVENNITFHTSINLDTGVLKKNSKCAIGACAADNDIAVQLSLFTSIIFMHMNDS